MIDGVETRDEAVLAAFDADPAPAGVSHGAVLPTLRRAARGGRRVLLLGPPGAGRSTLLRHWLAERLARDPVGFTFVFAGTGARHRRTPACFLYSLCERIRAALVEPDPLPVDADGLREALPGWLARAGSRGAALVVLDDLDQLVGDDLAGGLGWLPDYLPPTVTLVASAAPGVAATTLRDVGWDTVWIGGADEGVRDRLAERLAAETGRAAPEQTIAAGRYEDPEADRVLAWLWAAPEGLPAGRLAASDALLKRLGPLLRISGERITLRHERLRDAVATYRLDDREARRAAPRALANTEIDPLEQAWRLADAEDWPALLERLATPELLGRLESERFALTALWAALPARDTAASHLAQALTGLREPNGVNAEAIARAHLGGAEVLAQLGAEEAVAPLLTAAHRQLTASKGDGRALAIAALDHRLGILLAAAGDDAAAEAFRAALGARRDALGADHPASRASRHALAAWHEERGELDAAEALYREAVAAREQIVGADDPALIPHLGNLAGVLRAGNRVDAARPLLERALRLADAGPGRDHPSYAACLDNLAGVLYTGHDHEQAAGRYRAALAATERLFGPGHPATAACAHNLGTTLDALERYPEAERLYRHALDIRRAAYGEEHAETATSLHNLAGVLDVMGRRDEAEALYRRAVAVWTAVAGERHPATATSLNNLADLLREAGRYGEAEPLYLANLDNWRELLGEEHPNTLMTAAELGGLYADTGRHADAERLLREAVDRLERVMGADNLLHVDAACRLARVLRETGRGDEAVRLLEERYRRASATAMVLSPRIQKLRRHLEVARNAAGGGGEGAP